MSVLALVQPIVHVRRNRVTTSSLDVAAYFGKSHNVVLRSIRNLECSKEFWRCNFAPRDYKDERGKTQPSFDITKDGFAMLAFGFTGKEAAQFKERYIAAFNAMLEGLPDDRNAAIKSKRLANGVLMDSVKFDRERKGEEIKKHHYILENKLINWAVRGEFAAIDEASLPSWEVKLLERVRMYDETLLVECLEYHDRKSKLKQYADRMRVMLTPTVGKLLDVGV